MDVRERFKGRVAESIVADILHLIATVPNRREEAVLGDLPGRFDFWFDGGAGNIMTGCIDYYFANGTRARVGAPVPALSVMIEFADGRKVVVQQEEWRTEQTG